MDHRWDEMLQAEHRRRVEQRRYAQGPIERDEDVERRDQVESARRRVNMSPWQVGAAHWDQRDLYTRNSEIDASGYGRGPSEHPTVGSYAYHRDETLPPPPSERFAADGPNLYEREAWPWLNYDHVQRGPKGWQRADDAIREDACEALAYHSHLDASDIEVEVKSGEVTLSGTVDSRASKRLAEALVEPVRGVHDVHNRLTIRKDDDDLAFSSPIPTF